MQGFSSFENLFSVVLMILPAHHAAAALAFRTSVPSLPFQNPAVYISQNWFLALAIFYPSPEVVHVLLWQWSSLLLTVLLTLLSAVVAGACAMECSPVSLFKVSSGKHRSHRLWIFSDNFYLKEARWFCVHKSLKTQINQRINSFLAF